MSILDELLLELPVELRERADAKACLDAGLGVVDIWKAHTKGVDLMDYLWRRASGLDAREAMEVLGWNAPKWYEVGIRAGDTHSELLQAMVTGVNMSSYTSARVAGVSQGLLLEAWKQGVALQTYVSAYRSGVALSEIIAARQEELHLLQYITLRAAGLDADAARKVLTAGIGAQGYARCHKAGLLFDEIEGASKAGIHLGDYLVLREVGISHQEACESKHVDAIAYRDLWVAGFSKMEILDLDALGVNMLGVAELSVIMGKLEVMHVVNTGLDLYQCSSLLSQGIKISEILDAHNQGRGLWSYGVEWYSSINASSGKSRSAAGRHEAALANARDDADDITYDEYLSRT